MRVFVDTNLWVYRLDRRQPEKSSFIARWLRERAKVDDIVVSTQVLIELRSVLTGKLKPSFSAADTRAALNALSAFEVVGTDANLVLDAHELASAEQLSWFDALIVEAAIRNRCDVLYSEDFSHGRRFGDMRVHNPFK
jgi:predicted nucleic acid-binding protein